MNAEMKKELFAFFKLIFWICLFISQIMIFSIFYYRVEDTLHKTDNEIMNAQLLQIKAKRSIKVRNTLTDRSTELRKKIINFEIEIEAAQKDIAEEIECKLHHEIWQFSQALEELNLAGIEKKEVYRIIIFSIAVELYLSQEHYPMKNIMR